MGFAKAQLRKNGRGGEYFIVYGLYARDKLSPQRQSRAPYSFVFVMCVCAVLYDVESTEREGLRELYKRRWVDSIRGEAGLDSIEIFLGGQSRNLRCAIKPLLLLFDGKFSAAIRLARLLDL